MTNGIPAFEVQIDRQKCIGSGNCVFHAPGAFDQDSEGVAITANLAAQPESVIEFAASSCPVAAISVARKPG